MKPRSHTNEQRHEPTFFVDENLCGIFTARLRVAGLQIEELGNHFPPGTKDTVWLPYVGNLGWVAITMDQFKDDPEEQISLVAHGIPVFVLVGRTTHERRADIFLKKIKWVRRTLAAHREAFMARIHIASANHSITSCEDLLNRYARRKR